MVYLIKGFRDTKTEIEHETSKAILGFVAALWNTLFLAEILTAATWQEVV